MYKAPRGTADILPSEQKYWHYIESTARFLGQRYGYSRLDTPTFERTNLFVRGVGQGTDIVEKEMYSFEDKGGESLTLRPEGTAPVLRAYLEHGMNNLPQPVRLYYFSPAFRYERPQAGRFRQHKQFGVENLGDSDPSVDAEIIHMAWQLMSDLGLKDLKLILNSIGDANCRPSYLESLKIYYADHIEELCPDCRQRIERNPLRLLDCKQIRCSALAGDAPKTTDYLCLDCQDHWDKLIMYLKKLEMPFNLEHRLVRGLDYYTRTVFEIQPPEEGSQSTICGGGRYDGLMRELDGPDTPGIGFAVGLERIVLNLKRQNVIVPEQDIVSAVIVHLGDAAKQEALLLATSLRKGGLGVVLAPSGRSLKSQLRYANSLKSPYSLIIGEEEIEKHSVILKDMAKGDQKEVPASAIIEELGLATDNSSTKTR